MLDEEEMAEMFEELVDESGHVMALVGQILDQQQEPLSVVINDQVTDPKQRVLLDGSE